ncbi:acyl-CoA N-acyltransferase [Aspergillus unguis]
MAPQKAFRTALLPPPGAGKQFILPTRTIPSPTANPQIFNDAMAVRLEVFVDEQKCTAEFEIDEDDARSWHWVLYDTKASNPGTSTSTATVTDPGNPSTIEIPVGVARLVPPPHASHESSVAAYAPDGPDADTKRDITKEGYDLEHEPYIKFGRVAVLAGYRGSGVARRVMEEGMGWAGRNAGEINKAFKDVYEREGGLKRGTDEIPVWKGLALVHAQTDVQRFYERLGFVMDEELGTWIEEGIEHVGMWKRLDITG